MDTDIVDIAALIEGKLRQAEASVTEQRALVMAQTTAKGLRAALTAYNRAVGDVPPRTATTRGYGATERRARDGGPTVTNQIREWAQLHEGIVDLREFAEASQRPLKNLRDIIGGMSDMRKIGTGLFELRQGEPALSSPTEDKPPSNGVARSPFPGYVIADGR